jgi:hypothetical protein
MWSCWAAVFALAFNDLLIQYLLAKIKIKTRIIPSFLGE